MGSDVAAGFGVDVGFGVAVGRGVAVGSTFSVGVAATVGGTVAGAGVGVTRPALHASEKTNNSVTINSVQRLFVITIASFILKQ